MRNAIRRRPARRACGAVTVEHRTQREPREAHADIGQECAAGGKSSVHGSTQCNEVIVIEQRANKLRACGGGRTAGNLAPGVECPGTCRDFGIAGGDAGNQQPCAVDESAFVGGRLRDPCSNLYRRVLNEGAVREGERLLRDDALVAAIAFLDGGLVERGEEAVSFVVRVEKIKAPAFGIILLRRRDRWPPSVTSSSPESASMESRTT